MINPCATNHNRNIRVTGNRSGRKPGAVHYDRVYPTSQKCRPP
jgi:hypothetical protein